MNTEKNVITLVLLHLGIGVLIAFFPVLAKIYSVSIILFGLYFVIKNRNQHHEVLYVVAYLAGSEVFLRTNYANSYEFAKYFIFFFFILGLFYNGISKKAYPYLVFLLLLLPGILISIFTLEPDIRRKIFFDISGPICLAVSALYTYKKKISFRKVNAILLTIGLPILSTCAFLFINSPIVFTISNIGSNFSLSGGFGPNQMSTILGLGMFIFIARLILVSLSKQMAVLNLILAAYIYYRGLLTFSRGGMITGTAIVLLLLLSLYFNSKHYQSVKSKIVLTCAFILIIPLIASYQTNGALQKRYDCTLDNFEDTSEIKGREKIALREIQHFKENPVLGIGVGKGKEMRKTEFGLSISSHSEITRLLAEHGLLGLAAIFILLWMPMKLFLTNKRNIYLLSFLGFWFLTINHSAMRIAAPAFIYGLALLDINFRRKAIVSSV